MNMINNLKNVLDNSQPVTHFSPHNINKILQGLQSQTEKLKETARQLFSKCSDEQVFSNIDEITNKLNACENRIKLESKKNLQEKLKEIGQLCNSEKLKIFEIIENNKLTEITKFEKLKNYYNVFCSNGPRNQIHELFKNVDLKLSKLKKNIEIQTSKSEITDRIIKTLIGCFHKLTFKDSIQEKINDSSKKDDERYEEYAALQNILMDTYIDYKIFESTINNHLIKYGVIPKIDEFMEKIDPLKTWYGSLNTQLKKISVGIGLAPVFQKKYEKKFNNGEDDTFTVSYKQDFDLFLEEVNTYASFKQQLEEKENLFYVYDNFKQKNTIDIDLEKISSTLKIFNEQDNQFFANLNLLTLDEKLDTCDIKIKERLTKLQNNTVENFKILKNEIRKKWNECCLNLNKTRSLKELFHQFSEITEYLSLCYFMAVQIHGELRQNRLAVKSKSHHILAIMGCIFEFKYLCNLISNLIIYPNQECKITNKNTAVFFEKLNILQFNLYNKILTFFSIKPNPYLINLVDMKSSKEQEDTVKEQANLIIEEFNREFKESKESIKIDFKKHLNEICELIVLGLNRAEKALNWYANDYDYDHDFTKAYFGESKITNSLQTVASYILLGADKATEYVTSLEFSTEEIENAKRHTNPIHYEIPYEEFQSPFTKFKDILDNL